METGSPDASPQSQGEGRPVQRREGRALFVCASYLLPSAQNSPYTKVAYFGVAWSATLQQSFLPHHHQGSCGHGGGRATQLVVTPPCNSTVEMTMSFVLWSLGVIAPQNSTYMCLFPCISYKLVDCENPNLLFFSVIVVPFHPRSM